VPVSGALNRIAAFLYSMAGPMGAFNDVTVGSNTGVGLPHNLECNAATTPAFTAAPGWDATTGESDPTGR
jgi:hypothetical protein